MHQHEVERHGAEEVEREAAAQVVRRDAGAVKHHCCTGTRSAQQDMVVSATTTARMPCCTHKQHEHHNHVTAAASCTTIVRPARTRTRTSAELVPVNHKETQNLHAYVLNATPAAQQQRTQAHGVMRGRSAAELGNKEMRTRSATKIESMMRSMRKIGQDDSRNRPMKSGVQRAV